MYYSTAPAEFLSANYAHAAGIYAISARLASSACAEMEAML
jgi:hypothetical protein